MGDASNALSGRASGFSFLVVGLYAWLSTLSFGADALDIAYARMAALPAAAASEVADLLLWVGALRVLAGLAAIGFAWNARAARSLLIASLVITVCGFLAPAVLSPLLESARGALIGPGVRMIIGGSASILAFMGLHSSYRHQ